MTSMFKKVLEDGGYLRAQTNHVAAQHETRKRGIECVITDFVAAVLNQPRTRLQFCLSHSRVLMPVYHSSDHHDGSKAFAATSVGQRETSVSIL